MEIIKDGDFDSLGFVTHKRMNQLVFLENENFLSKLISNQNISCVITVKDLVDKLPNHVGVVVAKNPREAFYKFHNYLAMNTDFYWKDFSTEILTDAQIHPTAYVAEKNVRIGSGVVVEPGALILERSIIEDDVIIRSGATIGAEGFEFKRLGKEILHVVHAGGTLLREGVEIQCNSNIDRSVFGSYTEVGEYTKIDTLVHIGHDVKIGKRCMIAALTVICGSVTIGSDVWIGPRSAISSEINIGDRASVTIGSVVTKDVGIEQRVTGNFAIPHEKFLNYIKKISRNE
ncbi:MAG: UDP-3-O-(3-hydroxymyristoyl)glucosamine N-acyltransferase [Methanosarcinales archaeon]